MPMMISDSKTFRYQGLGAAKQGRSFLHKTLRLVKVQKADLALKLYEAIEVLYLRVGSN